MNQIKKLQDWKSKKVVHKNVRKLYESAKNGEVAKLQKLIEANKWGKDDTIDSPVGGEGESAFIAAAAYDHIDCLKLLLKAKSDPEYKCPGNGRTALWMAAFHDNIEIVEFLSDLNPNMIDEPNDDGDTPLLGASGAGRTEVCELLLKRKADVNWCNNNNENALFHSSYNAHRGVIEVLIENGIDRDHVDIDGDTVLHRAVGNEHEGMVNLLLSLNINPTIKNKMGLAPYKIAKRNGNEEIRMSLEAALGMRARTDEERLLKGVQLKIESTEVKAERFVKLKGRTGKKLAADRRKAKDAAALKRKQNKISKIWK